MGGLLLCCTVRIGHISLFALCAIVAAAVVRADDLEEEEDMDMDEEDEMESFTTAGASTCLSGYKGATVAAKAASYQSNYKSRHVVYNQARRQFGIGAKFSDCSSFVNSILRDTGYACLFAGHENTAFMNQEIRKRGGFKQTAVAGDIVMWGGHTGLITRACGGGKYSMVAMGVHGAGLANCQTVAGLKGWGSGGWLGFWTPRP